MRTNSTGAIFLALQLFFTCIKQSSVQELLNMVPKVWFFSFIAVACTYVDYGRHTTLTVIVGISNTDCKLSIGDGLQPTEENAVSCTTSKTLAETLFFGITQNETNLDNLFICPDNIKMFHNVLHTVDLHFHLLHRTMRKPKTFILVSSSTVKADNFPEIIQVNNASLDSEVFVVVFDSDHGKINVWESYSYRNWTMLTPVVQGIKFSISSATSCTRKVVAVREHLRFPEVDARRSNWKGLNIFAVAQVT